MIRQDSTAASAPTKVTATDRTQHLDNIKNLKAIISDETNPDALESLKKALKASYEELGGGT